MRTRDAAYGDLDAQAQEALGRTRSSASSRGMFFGSPLTTAEGTLESNLQRAKTGMNAQLLQRQAEVLGSDRARAIGQAMGFGENINQSALQEAGMGSELLQAGMQGSPDMAQLLQMYGGQQFGVNPALYQALGQMYGGGGG